MTSNNTFEATATLNVSKFLNTGLPNFHKKTLEIIEEANSIIAEYDGTGLTLRQLYYQFVAREQILNNQKEYNKLGVVINKARLAGLISWDAIIDRTRIINGDQHFEDPADILTVAAESYRIDSRSDQEFYLECWIEKEALIGVIEDVCRQSDIIYLACRGYFSQTAMYAASQRMRAAENRGQKTVLLHLGDHDPSGLDMTRDIQARLKNFDVQTVVNRLALNMDQIRQYSPPPNFAKLSDTRAADYISKYDNKSWELDALKPKVITGLINHAVAEYTDQSKRQVLMNLQESQKQSLAYIADHWQKI